MRVPALTEMRADAGCPPVASLMRRGYCWISDLLLPSALKPISADSRNSGPPAARTRRDLARFTNIVIHGAHLPEPKASITSVSLLLRLSHSPSDQAAWEEFADRYGVKIYSWSRVWQLQDADAQDVTQAVLVKLAIRMRQFVYDPAQSFRGWLRTVVKNACRDYIAERRRCIGAVARGEIDEADPIQSVAARDDLARRLEAEFDLELLEEAQRRVQQRIAVNTWEAYRLTAIEGFSGAEVAAQLGMKVAAVFVSRCHVTKHLNREVQALENAAQASPGE
jgi:RNA polymerase sigma factor (sigma-70 family)